MAAIPANIKRDPRFIYLVDYMTPEEAAKVVASGIAINRPGIVPSLQIPTGNKGCQGLGQALIMCPSVARRCRDGSSAQYAPGSCNLVCPEDALSAWAGDIEAPTIAYDPGAVWRTMPLNTGTTTLSPGGGSPGAVYPTSAPPARDGALDWVEQNWILIAGGLGIVLAASLLTKR